jgi:hypothetical protein
MDRCTHHQIQMLDYVYDLLDEDVVRELALHLEHCTDCQTALRAARGQQQLLAAAARLEFPSFRFRVPEETTPVAPPAPAQSEPAPQPVLLPARPKLLPFPSSSSEGEEGRGRGPRGFAWRGWLSAAAVLLALGAPGWFCWDYLAARHDLDRAAAIDTRARRDRDDVKTRLDLLDRDENEKVQELEKSLRQQERSITVIGPRTLQSGTPNDYRIETRRGDSREVPTRLTARVIDKSSGEVLHEEKDRESDGSYRLTLPANLRVGPNAHVLLEVEADGGGTKSRLREEFQLTAPLYLTHLATDKPIYQPGETVRFRSLTVERFSLVPAREPLALRFSLSTPLGLLPVPQAEQRDTTNALALEAGRPVHFAWDMFSTPLTPPSPLGGEGEKKQPSPPGGEGAKEKPSPLAGEGEKDKPSPLGGEGRVRGRPDDALRGIAGGEWKIPAGSPEGEYTLLVSEDQNRFPPQRRKFLVHHYKKPRILTELDFTHRGYGPGEEVVAIGRAVRADGRPFAQRSVTATVNVDGKAGAPLQLITNDEGKVHVRFTLPRKIEKERASLDVAFHEDNWSESIFRPVPLVLKRLVVEFYPEGGSLVPDGPNRVYFRVRTPQGRPAELKGRLFDELGDEVARVETFHNDTAAGAGQGTGVFTLTPHRGHVYRLTVDSPDGVTVADALEATDLGKVALTIPSPVTTAHEPIVVRVRSAGTDRRLLVAAYCRGRLLEHQWVTAKAEQEETVCLNPLHGVGGVYRLTVFEEVEAGGTQAHLEPRAERLVYRRHRDRLNLEIATDKPSYVPGEKVQLTLTSRGEDQELLSSVAMVAVVDRTALALGEERTARSLPTHFYLMSNVQGAEELENADFLLTANPAAERVLDLLLGTQGWRRFVERRGEAALALAPVEVPRVDRDKDLRAEQAGLGKKIQAGQVKLHEQFQADRKRLLARQSELEETLVESRTEPAFLAARARLASYERVVRAIHALFPLVGLFLVILAAVLLGRGLGLPAERAVPRFSAVAACTGLLIILGTIAFSGRPEREGEGIEDAQVLGLPEKKESEKQVASAPKSKGERDTEDPRRRRTEREPRTSKDNFSKEDENVARKNAEPSRPSEGVPFAELPAPRGDAQPPAPAPPPPRGKMRPFMMKPPDDKKPSSTEPGSSQAGAGGGYGSPSVSGVMNRHSATLTPERAADKPGFGQGATRTSPDDAEKEVGEKLKRVESFLSKEGRNGTAASQQGNVAPTARPFGDGTALFTREYRHVRQEETSSFQARDFTDTVCWQPALLLNGGQTGLGFHLNDAVTSYQVTVFGHTLDGRLAAATRILEARKPLTLQPFAPDELTTGDRADVRVNVVNRTSKEQSVDVEFFRASGKTPGPVTPKEPAADDRAKTTSRLKLQAGESAGLTYPFTPGTQPGDTTFQIEGRLQNLPVDAVRRNIHVVPEGFPVTQSRSDLLAGRAEQTVLLPREWVKGTLNCRVEVFPSALAEVQKGLDALRRQPATNFEQIVTASHSNVLLLDQLREAKELRPELEKQSHELLAESYRAMTSFESLDPVRKGNRGFGWFAGTTPANEELTAYGLMQLSNLDRFQAVDRALLDRMRVFLLSRRDSKGGFRHDAKRPDGPPPHIGDAFIVWALTESGTVNVTHELNALAVRAKSSKDPYFLALVANSLARWNRMVEAGSLLQKIVDVQKDDGHLDAEQTSVTGSRGRDLQIETTALAVLAWQRAAAVRFRIPIERAVRWLDQQRDGSGAFGSTQATVLALKALASRGAASRAVEDGELSLSVGGQRVARLAFKARTTGPLVLTIPEPEKVLKPGANSVRLEITGKNRLPATLSWSYHSLVPVHDEACSVRLSTSLDRTQAEEGQRVQLTVRLENTADGGQSVAVAVVGLPAGLSLSESLPQLSAYKQQSKVGAFEVRGRELVLSWPGLAPRQKIEVPIELLCRLPGDYRGPASQAYLQYDADHKAWAAPLHIRIVPKK